MGFGTQKETAKTTNDPWAAQSPYLQQGFSAASNALGQASTAPKPTDFVNQFSPEALGVFQKMLGYSADGSASRAIGQDVATAGAGSLVDSFRKLNEWTPQGGTASNIEAATQYANNPAVGGMVDSAVYNAERNARENILPGITRGAAGTGNLNSSKRDIKEAIIGRGLAENRLNTEADIRGNLFNQGLQLAEGGRQFDNSSTLDAIRSAITGGTGAVSTGVGAIDSGTGQDRDAFGINTTGAEAERTAGQTGLDNQMQKFQFGTDSPFAALNNYWNIVGSNNWGGTSNSTGTKTASPAQVIGGLMGAAGSLFRGPGK